VSTCLIVTCGGQRSCRADRIVAETNNGGDLVEIESAFRVDFDRKTMEYSPDRLDALVWALTGVCVEGEPQKRPLFTAVAMGSGRPRTPHWDRMHG